MDFLNPVLLLLAVVLPIFAILFMVVIAESARHIEQFEHYQQKFERNGATTLFNNNGLFMRQRSSGTG